MLDPGSGGVRRAMSADAAQILAIPMLHIIVRPVNPSVRRPTGIRRGIPQEILKISKFGRSRR